jgi:hypothetical protein
MPSLAEDLARSPDAFPHSLDAMANVVYMVGMTRDAYRAASFLDQRMLTPGHRGRWLPWRDIAEASAGLPVACGMIFHIGHVGSTLLSRLLGDWPGLFSLREPAALRTLAELDADRDAADCPWPADSIDAARDRLLGLWSRTYAPGERAVVKATSFVAEMAAAILGRHPSMPAVAMTLSPESYLAVIMAGDNSRGEIRAMARARLRRLHRRLGNAPFRLYALSEGEMVAMCWLCETLALAAAARVAGSRLLRIDFDAMLADPAATLDRAATHLGAGSNPALAGRLTAGEHMTRYSKSPDHAYSAELRRAVMDDARRVHGVEIARGLAWLDRAIATHQASADAIAFAEGRTLEHVS